MELMGTVPRERKRDIEANTYLGGFHFSEAPGLVAMIKTRGEKIRGRILSENIRGDATSKGKEKTKLYEQRARLEKRL